MAKDLIIVESPSKARTISRFLGRDYNIQASMGHIRDLPEKELGVDIGGNFQPKYVVTSDKKKIVAELKKAAKEAHYIYLASDHDREGEAIAWHLLEALSLDESRTRRIVFHEITKPAIDKALAEPHTIDRKLVDAQQARRVLDRLVGFELSPVLWRKVQPSLSAGRVQSVAVRLIVDREEEINAFQSDSFFKVTAEFSSPDGSRFLAELSEKFKTLEEAKDFLNRVQNRTFQVESVEKKPGSRNPAPPFTTSTLQQEASRKLGMSVTQTMRVAQKLYEAGFITYMRTDSLNLSSLALAAARDEITDSYGKEYSKTRNFKTKSKGAQEAHEAIRPTDLHEASVGGDAQMQRLYELIWKRTIASQMAPAQLEKTQIMLRAEGLDERFTAKGEVILFDGFLRVYIEGTDDETSENGQDGRLPKLSEGDKLQWQKIEALMRSSKAPARYTEASLVRKLEELGIGRPSTYAPTISTIQKRKYVVKENREGRKVSYPLLILKQGASSVEETEKTETAGAEKQKLFPTDIGSLVNRFLVEYFENYVDYNFTAEVEKEFDEIAEGRIDWQVMIRKFYDPFHKRVNDTLENAGKFKGERLLGNEAATGAPVSVKIGRFGPMVQIGDADSPDKPRFASLRANQSIETISLEEALALFDFPRSIGSYEDAELTVAIGRFGPYVKHRNAFFSLAKDQDPGLITRDEAVTLIEAKRQKDREAVIQHFEAEDIRILKGRYGPYISHKKKNYKIPKGSDPASLTLEQCLEIIAKGPAPKGRGKGRGKGRSGTKK